MQPDNPSIPHTLAQVLPYLLATFVGVVGGWFGRRKREPIELAKLSAETRQINISTDVQLMTAAMTAIANAERLRADREYQALKNEDLKTELEDSRAANGQLMTQLTLQRYQVRRLKGILDEKGIDYSDVDKPRASD